MATIIISIEDLSSDSKGGNVDIICKRIARPGEPDDTPTTHLADFIQRAIAAYINNTGGKLNVEHVPYGAAPCWH